MQRINADNSIYITRGDSVLFDVKAMVDGEPYTFKPGDVVRISIYRKKSCSDIALVKDFLVAYESDMVQVYLSKEDTKIGKVINKPTDFWYEVELNPDGDPQTIIGYDEDGAKVFRLFPEGSED